MEDEDETAWEHISKPLTRALCSIALHKFTEPHQTREFESVECSWCKRKWVVNTRNHKVFEVIR